MINQELMAALSGMPSEMLDKPVCISRPLSNGFEVHTVKGLSIVRLKGKYNGVHLLIVLEDTPSTRLVDDE